VKAISAQSTYRRKPRPALPAHCRHQGLPPLVHYARHKEQFVLTHGAWVGVLCPFVPAPSSSSLVTTQGRHSSVTSASSRPLSSRVRWLALVIQWRSRNPSPWTRPNDP
jgi:hypothetical protein